jgi:iduronate 2-sulfatase
MIRPKHQALALFVLIWGSDCREAAAAPKFNVLHIVSDDLNVNLGVYGHAEVKSPNIDRLAARGVTFDRAYCQFPLCNPSRASFMTGLRPDTTGVYENRTNFRTNVPDAVSIPQSFLNAGYRVSRVGKLYHYGVPTQIGTDGLDDPLSWETVVNPRGRDVDDIALVNVLESSSADGVRTVIGRELKNTGGTLSWLASEGTDSEQTDGKGAAAAIAHLEERAKDSNPFYLAVGFYRPHTPYVAPKAYFELYPSQSIKLPVIPRREAIQAYQASTTFMDARVGELLDALQRLKLEDSTIVVFHSDHGYHLGEKNLWQKMSIFEESVRVPLIISVPGNHSNGQRSPRTVELVDLHKTLTDLCGIAGDSKTEGFSLRPLVEKPDSLWVHAAYSQVTRGDLVGTFEAGNGSKKNTSRIMGRSVRTERFRYTEWDGGAAGVELYDHETDPGEYNNLANLPEHASVVASLKKTLSQGAPLTR